MNEESDLVANILLNDINTLVEDLNNVIKAHNVLVDRWNELKGWLQERKFVYNITGEVLDEDTSITEVLIKMQELEKGSDVNE